MLRSRIAAALVARQASALAFDARFRSKVDGLVARRRGDLLVVLEDCTDPANAASIARCLRRFGVPELLFVTSRRPAPAFDPCGEGLRRLSASATQWVKLTSYASVDACYDRLRRDGFASAACVMDEDAVLLPATDDDAARRDLLAAVRWLSGLEPSRGSESRRRERCRPQGAHPDGGTGGVV